jgi:hypothetical protein
MVGEGGLRNGKWKIRPEERKFERKGRKKSGGAVRLRRLVVFWKEVY